MMPHGTRSPFHHRSLKDRSERSLNGEVPDMIPQDGDILVSKPTATIEHCVSVVGESTGEMCLNHDTALVKARELAKERHVDAWLTGNHTHFLKVASYRRNNGRGGS
jgi:hypothetical protein